MAQSDFVDKIGGFDPSESLKPKKGPAVSIVNGEISIKSPQITDNQGLKEGTFKGLLESYVDDVNQSQFKSSNEVAKLASGQTGDVAEVMQAMDEAQKSFMMMKAIRDRLEGAYHEIMRLSP